MTYLIPNAGQAVRDPRSRRERRPAITTAILIMVVLNIVMDVVSRRFREKRAK